MDFMHILGQKEAIWNIIFSIYERRRGPPNVAGPGKTSPRSLPLDGPVCLNSEVTGQKPALITIATVVYAHV